jgi:hypothetical protein
VRKESLHLGFPSSVVFRPWPLLILIPPMSTEFWISTTIALLGLLIGVLATLWATKKLAHRPRLRLKLSMRAAIIPQDLDVAPDLIRFYVGDRQIYNLALLNLELSYQGYRDINLPAHDPTKHDRSILMPFIQFTDFQVLALTTLNNDQSRFYVPFGKGFADTRLYINVQRIKGGSTIKVQLLGTLFKQRTAFSEEQAQLFPGTIPDVDVSSSGLFAKEHLRSIDGPSDRRAN